ncbi:MAG: hypothetical protein C6I00_03425 [Nitratiruptor sp.]|nr:hypothetical protein [Nitratiruptor sp.]NPA83150.1 glycosyltransferase family 9 protein [Campylobacterota bacterium]
MIGVYRYSALGDIAAALPVLRAFKEPPIILTSPMGYELLKDEFEEFIVLPSKRVWDLIPFITKARRRIDSFIDLQNNDRSRFIRLFFPEVFTNRAIPWRGGASEYFHAIAAQSGVVGELDYSFTPKEPTYIVLNTGSSPKWHSKRLPDYKWQEFSRILHERFGLPFLLTGDRSEREYVEHIARQLVGRVEVVAGKTSIAELKELLGQAFLVVSTDSAPMHIAAVQKTPTIGLFGATNWINSAPFGPWSVALYDRRLFPDGRPFPSNRREVGPYYEGIDLEEGLQRLEGYLYSRKPPRPRRSTPLM